MTEQKTANEPVPTLHDAVQRRDIGAARNLLSAGADPNGQGGGGRTLLHEAVLNGDHEMVSLLAGAGADVSLWDAEGLAPLHQAALYGHAAAALALLSAGADPNALDRMTWTPLHHAVAQHRSVIALVLLNYGADPDAADDQGMSPRAALMLEPDAEIEHLLNQAAGVPTAGESDDSDSRCPEAKQSSASTDDPSLTEAQAVAVRNFLNSLIAKLLSDGVSPTVLFSEEGEDLIRAEMMDVLTRNL